MGYQRGGRDGMRELNSSVSMQLKGTGCSRRAQRRGARVRCLHLGQLQASLAAGLLEPIMLARLKKLGFKIAHRLRSEAPGSQLKGKMMDQYVGICMSGGLTHDCKGMPPT